MFSKSIAQPVLYFISIDDFKHKNILNNTIHNKSRIKKSSILTRYTNLVVSEKKMSEMSTENISSANLVTYLRRKPISKTPDKMKNIPIQILVYSFMVRKGIPIT